MKLSWIQLSIQFIILTYSEDGKTCIWLRNNGLFQLPKLKAKLCQEFLKNSKFLRGFLVPRIFCFEKSLIDWLFWRPVSGFKIIIIPYAIWVLKKQRPAHWDMIPIGPSISFYPDFILILSRWNLDKIWIKLEKIWIKSG